MWNQTFEHPHIGGKGGEVVCGQVWWPILGICPLHLTHPSAHSQQWTHTRSSGQPCCGARGAVGGSVPCSRVSPQSWYWRWREHLLFIPPTDNPCRTWESNLQPLGYKSNSLTIRPRLPKWHDHNTYSHIAKTYSQNGMIITPREYSTVRLGVESGSSYRSIESSTIRGHPYKYLKHIFFKYN